MPIRTFEKALKTLEVSFRQLEQMVPAPISKPWKDGFVARYADRTIEQAIIQKLARTISGLRALKVLLETGLFQELCIIQRTLDEVEEDVMFLSLALINNDVTERHRQFLEYFYAEEFENPSDIYGSHQSRPMVSRDKIRAYVNRLSGTDSSHANVVGKIIAKSYSGYVHAASPQVMDMYLGHPPKFDISGEYAVLRFDLHASDAQNYFYRALVSMAFAAKAFGDEVLFSRVYEKTKEFEAAMTSQEQQVSVAQ
jgi:hypothetical protein